MGESTKKNGADSGTSPPLEPSRAQELAENLAQLVYNTRNHNWLSDADRDGAVAAFFNTVSALLDDCPELSFRLKGESMTINGQEVGQVSHLVEVFVRHLGVLNVNNFSMHAGLAGDAFSDLLHLFSAEPYEVEELGGFTAALEAGDVKNVVSKTIIYREVAEDDVVLSRSQLDAAEKDVADAENVHERVANVAEVLSHLQGEEDSEASAEVVEGLNEMASDARQLSEMVMQAAEARKEEAEDQVKESLAGALVGCVQRAFNTLLKDPSIRTQKGKKELQKKLKAVEGELLGMMDKLDDQEQEACKVAVRETVDQLNDEIQVDALASEYMKRLRAIEKTEERLTRYIRKKGADGIEDSELAGRLAEDGLPGSQWKDLLYKSDVSWGLGDGPGSGGPGGAGGGGSATLENLNALLTKMEQTVGELAGHPGEDRKEELVGVLSDVGSEIGNAVEETSAKIRHIAREVEADEEAIEKVEELAKKQGIGLRLSRKKLLEMLAEVVQELSQPLAVIGCSIEMVVSQRLGDIPETQLNMLTLISESAEKARELIEGMQGLVGVPDTMSPDRELLQKVAQT